MCQQPMRVLDGALASLDGDIHDQSPSATSTTSMPRGNNVALMARRANRSSGAILACSTAVPSMPGPRSPNANPSLKLSTCRISVVERSGYSLVPNEKRSSAGSSAALAINAKLQIDGSATTGALVWNFSHFVTSEASDIRGSSQIGVSWSNNGGPIAAVPRIIPGGVPAAEVMQCTLTGRAIASITERKVVCADNTLSANPAGSSANVVIA